MAGSLVAMAARLSPAWEDGAGVAAQAQALRARVTPLALADSEAYAEVLAALASGAEQRPDLAAALRRASEVPLAITEAAADTATLAAYTVSRCGASVRGEALVAELDQTHPAGFFEGAIPRRRERFPYRLRVAWPDGIEREVDDPYRFPPVLGELDVHLMGEGTHLRLYEKLGFTVIRTDRSFRTTVPAP